MLRLWSQELTSYSAALPAPWMSLSAACALCSLLEPIDEPSTRNSRGRLGAKDRIHRDDKPFGGIFNDHPHERTSHKIRLNHLHRHPAPAQARAQECVLCAEVRQSPGSWRENAQVFPF